MEIQPYYPPMPYGQARHTLDRVAGMVGHDRREAKVYIENELEEIIVRDAIAPLGLFTYFRQVRELSKKRAENYPKGVVFNNRQLKHIQKRVAPWEKHPFSEQNEKTVETAHNIAITIANYLGEPEKIAKKR